VRLPAILLVPALLFLAGCGDGDDNASSSGPPVELRPGQRLTLRGEEYSFIPSNVVARPGTELEVRLENRGSLAHNVKLLRDGEQVGGTPSLPSGRAGSATISVSPGTYELVCTVGDHAELGMKGALRVKE